jgi:ParB family chromosome partitioning protein
MAGGMRFHFQENEMSKAGGLRAATKALAGVDTLFGKDAEFSHLSLTEITISPQVRRKFETPEQTLEDLAADIKEKGVIQPILVRPIEGRGFELVAGERRYRASILAGLSTIPAFIKSLTDEEAAKAQKSENIHRLNLAATEEARAVQDDLERLGSREAVAAYYNKSLPWVAKALAMLDLTPGAQALVDNHITADKEVILGVRQIENINPTAAADLVAKLEETKGAEDARNLVKAIKDQVKPPKKPKTPRMPEAAPKQEEIFNPDDQAEVDSALDALYAALAIRGESLAVAFKRIPVRRAKLINTHMERVWNSAASSNSLPVKAYFEAINAGIFSASGKGAVLAAAFLSGIAKEAFSAQRILERFTR